MHRYDQGMMSLINTNYHYLGTMGIAEDDPLVGVIVAVYYLGCAIGMFTLSLRDRALAVLGTLLRIGYRCCPGFKVLRCVWKKAGDFPVYCHEQFRQSSYVHRWLGV